jgi:hypothetical protein
MSDVKEKTKPGDSITDLIRKHGADTKREEEKTETPKKKWRNVFQAMEDGLVWQGPPTPGEPLKSGDIVFGKNTYRTAEAARKACIAGIMAGRWHPLAFFYLGPEEVE